MANVKTSEVTAVPTDLFTRGAYFLLDFKYCRHLSSGTLSKNDVDIDI